MNPSWVFCLLLFFLNFFEVTNYKCHLFSKTDQFVQIINLYLYILVNIYP